MTNIPELKNIIKDSSFRTKIRIYFSSKSAGDDYDPYEDNFTFANTNPITLLGYVRELTPESAFYKQYGLHQQGVKEIIVEEKYRNYFELANKIEINDVEYQNFKDGQGSRTLITKRPLGLIRVIVSRNG